MKIIKEYCLQSKRVVIRTNTYADTLRHLNILYKAAVDDFPSLLMDEVGVVYYGGERYARTYGIEFEAEPSEITNTYEQINQLEESK